MAKSSDTRKEKHSINSKQASHADGKTDKIAQLRNAKTHFSRHTAFSFPRGISSSFLVVSPFGFIKDIWVH